MAPDAPDVSGSMASRATPHIRWIDLRRIRGEVGRVLVAGLSAPLPACIRRDLTPSIYCSLVGLGRLDQTYRCCPTAPPVFRVARRRSSATMPR
ncbi:hypothetical protein QE377_000242 [Microbacterium sp. SORGH_AS 862]|nr:hypothetical protein [Microbacterium sp. SORGH_AS_0862]